MFKSPRPSSSRVSMESPRPVTSGKSEKDLSEKRLFSRNTDSSRVSSTEKRMQQLQSPARGMPSPGRQQHGGMSPISNVSDDIQPEQHRNGPYEDDNYLSMDGWCPQVYSCLQPMSSKTNSNSLAALTKSVRTQESLGNRSQLSAMRNSNLPSNQISGWRNCVAQKILANSSDEEDEIERVDNSVVTGAHPECVIPTPFTQPDDIDHQSMVSQLSMGSRQSTHRSKMSAHGDTTRIVAPHVGRLSPSSCVEVMLYNEDERVTVLCSSDVLKMKSSFFHDVLIKQEAETGSKLGMWRGLVEINEAVPYEAATFLESLHDSATTKVHADWSYAWARLSVRWVIEELLVEYASQIDAHMSSIVTRIRSAHWRTCPDTLIGMRVAMFRKASTCIPTVVTGTVIAALPSTGYSKLRVSFETATDGVVAGLNVGGPQNAPILPSTLQSLRQRSTSASSLNSNALAAVQETLNSPPAAPKQIIADVCEPIWVRQDKDGAAWMEPDEYCCYNKPIISVTDRRLFWEMARAITTLPALASYLKGSIKSPPEICSFLLRKENKTVWFPEAPLDFLPKDDALDLIRKAYCLPTFSLDRGSSYDR